jgi:hypothetical protein
MVDVAFYFMLGAGHHYEKWCWLTSQPVSTNVTVDIMKQKTNLGLETRGPLGARL